MCQYFPQSQPPGFSDGSGGVCVSLTLAPFLGCVNIAAAAVLRALRTTVVPACGTLNDRLPSCATHHFLYHHGTGGHKEYVGSGSSAQVADRQRCSRHPPLIRPCRGVLAHHTLLRIVVKLASSSCWCVLDLSWLSSLLRVCGQLLHLCSRPCQTRCLRAAVATSSLPTMMALPAATLHGSSPLLSS